MNPITGNFMSEFGVNGMHFFFQLAFSILLFGFLASLVFRAVKLIVRAVVAFEKSAKAQQDTVYLLREIATLLKSKEEKPL